MSKKAAQENRGSYSLAISHLDEEIDRLSDQLADIKGKVKSLLNARDLLLKHNTDAMLHRVDDTGNASMSPSWDFVYRICGWW